MGLPTQIQATSSGSYSSESTLWLSKQPQHQGPSRQLMCSLAWAATPRAKNNKCTKVLETQRSQTQVSTSLSLKNHQERSIPGSTSWLATGFLLFVLPASDVNLCVQYSLSEKYTLDWISTNLNDLILTKFITSMTSCPHKLIALKSWVLDFGAYSWRITPQKRKQKTKPNSA